MSETAVSVNTEQGVATAMAAEYVDEPNISLALPPDQEENTACAQAGAIAPRHPPEYYIRMCETNTGLRPVIDAIIQNVDAHGHRFEPWLELESEEAVRAVRRVIAFERLRALRGPFVKSLNGIEELAPTKKQIKARLKQIEWRMAAEEMKMIAFFSSCCPGVTNSFVQLRKLVRGDFLSTGNAYIEGVEDGQGELAELHHLKSATMRARPTLNPHVNDGLVPVRQPRRTSAITMDYVDTRRRFRSFVQFNSTRSRYFKEYGDQRYVSSVDGRVYPSRDALREIGHPPANPVMWLKNPSLSGHTVYGVPPWLAGDAVASGLRDAQIVNATHFSEKAIPQMMIFIQGARPDDKLVNTVQEYFRGAKGIRNYHRVLIISATPPMGSSNRVVIEAKPLKNAIPNDGLYQQYEANCAQTLRTQFRIAKLVVGLGEDINRATAEAVLLFLEEQVFGPIRSEFDAFMNNLLLDMEVMHWRFVSNSPINRNPREAAEIAKALSTVGAPTMNELRRVVGDVLNMNMPRIEKKWADLPMAHLRGAYQGGIVPGIEEYMSAPGGGEDGQGEGLGPTPVAEAEDLAREVEERDPASAASGVEVKTTKGDALVYVLPLRQVQGMLRGAGGKRRRARTG